MRLENEAVIEGRLVVLKGGYRKATDSGSYYIESHLIPTGGSPDLPESP
jgi:hypothetical protein